MPQERKDRHGKGKGRSTSTPSRLNLLLPLPIVVRVVDGAGKLKYVEYVPEVKEDPNYDAALAAI